MNFGLAQTKTWTGSSNSNWNTSGNWSPSGVPDNTYDVVIPSGTSNSPVINANATAKSLNISGILTIGNSNADRTITVSGNVTINTGGQFITAGDGGNILNVSGNITNSGTFNMNIGTATATTVLNGANQSFNTTNFYALTLSGSGTKTFTSTGATTIANTLTINSGIVANLGTQTHTANTLFLGSTQSLPGSWGSSSSAATNKSDTYFAATTGQINVSSSTCANFSTVLQITNVSLNTLSKTSSGTTGYEDFTADTPTTITQGKGYSLTVKGNTGGDQNVYYSAFFDWNNDGDFDDSGEYYQIGTIRNSTGTTGVASVYITVPSVTTGNIKMRIIGRLTGYNNTPCAISGSSGQMEDYKVTVQSGCTGTAGAPVSTVSTVCPNVPFTISLPSSTLSDGATYVWQTSPDNATWSNATPAPITFFGTEAFNSLPANTNVYGSASVTGNQLLLTPATNSLNGAFVIQNIPGTNMDAFTVNFDYQASGGTGADGFSLSYADDITSDAAGGEGGQGSGIIVQFDTYDNEGVATGSRIRVLYAGNVLFNSAIDVPALRPTTGNTPVVLTVDSKGKLTLRVNGSIVVSDLALPAAYLSTNKSAWKFKFAARTGGSNDNHIIDNLLIRYQDIANSNSTFSTTQTAKTYYRVQVTCGTTITTTSVLVDMSTAVITTQPTAPTPVCTGSGTRTISVVATGSGQTYSWRLGGTVVTNGGVISGQGTNTLTLTNPTAANAGSYTVVIGDACSTSVTSNAVTLTVNALPTPTFAVSPGANICSNTDVTYTTQASQTNYIWTVPGTAGTDYTITSGGIGTGSNTVTLRWLTAGSKTVSINYTNSNGCTATTATSSTTTVNLRPTVTFTVSPGANTCSNTDVTYTTQTGQSSYTWTVPGTAGTDYTITAGGIGTGSNTVTLRWLTAGSKTVSVNYTNASSCNATTATTSITTVNLRPTVSFNASPGAATCSNTDVTYTTQSGMSNYIWTVPGTAGTDYTITTGGIGTGSNTVTLRWLTAGSKTVTINYTDTNSCTATTATSTATTVNLRPTATFTASPGAATCSNTDVVYTTQPSQTNYTWAVPGTAGTDYTITSGGIGTGSNTVTLRWLTAGSKTVTVNYSNASGCNATTAASSTTTVNLRPTITFTSSPGASTCSNTDVTYTTQTGQTNYTWIVPGTAGTDYTITSGGIGTGSNTVTLRWLTSGNKTVTINYTDGNSCTATTTASSATTVNLRPTVTFTASPGASTCASSDVTYTTQSAMSNYIWTIPGTAGTDYTITSGGIGTGSNTVTLRWLTAGSKTVTVNYTNASSCTATTAASSTTTVNALPAITTHPQTVTVCEGKSHTFTVVTSAGSPTYQWQYSPDNAAWTNTNGAPGATGHTTASLSVSNIALSYSGYYVRCIVTVGTCSSNSNSALLTVNPTPVAPTASVTTQPTCAAPTGTITVSSPAPAAGITYSVDGTTFTNTTGVFTGLAAGPYNVTTKNSSGCESPITVVTINAYAGKTWNGSVSTSWNTAGNWTPSGVPTSADCVTIPDLTAITNKPQITGTNTVAQGYTLNLNNNSLLTVQSTNTLTITSSVTVNTGSTLTFENNASLVQTTNAVNSGNIVYKRDTQPVRRYDFTYWSAPVKATPKFTLYDLSSTTLADKYYWYNATSSAWVIDYNGTLEMMPGQGYIVRAPQGFDIVSSAVYSATFTGVPNNGDIPFTPIATKWNLIGNPYPSAIDADLLISNTGTGALYFWTHNSPPNGSVAGDAKYNYTTNDYAVYTLTGSTGTASGAATMLGKIAAGQAFFFKASTGSNIVFTNSMRVAGNNSQFFKTTETNIEKNRLWLNFSNAEGAFKQALIGYIDGATNSFDQNYDAATLNGNTYVDFYSINDAKKLTVQGRAIPFEEEDVIPLGYKTTVAGEFTIAIDHTDGLFDGQKVYLEDKLNSTVYDLKAGDYKFTTEIGTFTDRFNLRYTNKTLGTGDFENVKDGLLISVKDKVINVLSSKENIKEVSIFDINGRLLYNKKKVGGLELSISNLQAAEQVLLVKVTLENKAEVTRKIIFK
ncbi:T9SS sorting signal type C domain-containing protein [Flavobacterium sp.]|uniref:T9SS sorting signal type C domain-containing protein n=1 Tax=Flavobacterium sp. TaxID=239 RepID=UPI0031D60901